MASSEFVVEIDIEKLRATVADIKRELAQRIRSLPVTEASDGTKWVKVTDLIELAEKLEAST